MSQFIIAGIRVAVRAAIGTALIWLAQKGVNIPDHEAVIGSITVVVIGLVTYGLNHLEVRFPWLVPVLSLGATSNGPTYEKGN